MAANAAGGPTTALAPAREVIAVPKEWSESSDHRDRQDRADPVESAEPTDRIDPADPMLPMEAIEPTLPMDSTEPCEPIDSRESVDHNDRREEPVEGMSGLCVLRLPHGHPDLLDERARDLAVSGSPSNASRL